MGIELILALVKKYLPQLLLGIALIIGIWYLYHSIYQSGYGDGQSKERAEWTEDKLKTDEESRQILEKNKLAYEVELAKQKSNLIGVFNESEKLRKNLQLDLDNSNSKRMFVGTKSPASCGDAGKTKTADTGRTSGESGEIYKQELDRGTEQAVRNKFREIEEGKNACKLLMDLVKDNFEVVN